MQVQTFQSGNFLDYFLCQGWDLIKPQSAVQTCGARQALISCVSDTGLAPGARHSAGGIVQLLEERSGRLVMVVCFCKSSEWKWMEKVAAP